MPYKDPEKRKKCARESARRRYGKNPARIKEIQRRSAAKNKTKIRARTRIWYKGYYQKWKNLVYTAYGNACACCGETAREFLTIDHVNRDGKAHRKQFWGGGNYTIFQDIVRRGYPKDFRLLCMNCNWGTRMGNACPHQQFLRSADFDIRASVIPIPFLAMSDGVILHAS